MDAKTNKNNSAATPTSVKPRVRFNPNDVGQVDTMFKDLKLNTVCTEATCPNIGECFASGTASFMILGKHCSRNCRFCDVATGGMEPVDPMEPGHLADAVKQLKLNHVVITCVARDDLPDGGAGQFAKCIELIHQECPDVTVEVLISDLQGDHDSIDKVIQAKPDIINHNVETVERISPMIRHRATYERSLGVLEYVKEQDPEIFTKTGIMLGLGETEEEIYQTMDDCLAVGVDFFTIGQYLQPSPKHYPLSEYVSRQKFGEYNRIGRQKGFKFVTSGPQVRSSYKAHEALHS